MRYDGPYSTDGIFSKTVFEQIRQHLSKCLCADDAIQHIESLMEILDIGDLGETFFDIAWDLTYFVIEMQKSQSLGFMITFNGSIDNSWAGTSREYVKRIWQKGGDHSERHREGYLLRHNWIFL